MNRVLSSRPSEKRLITGTTGKDWKDLSQKEREANARFVIEGAKETRRNTALALKDRGGKKRRYRKKKTLRRKH